MSTCRNENHKFTTNTSNVFESVNIDVVKKMLAPLRTGNYPVVQLPHYVDAMKTVVFNHFSTETVRNLATFLVSTLKQSK